MFYSAELEFLRLILKNLNINSVTVSENDACSKKIDAGLREFLFNGDDRGFFERIYKKINENTIYKVKDSFGCSYIFMILPETEDKSVFVAGPYLNSEITHQKLAEEAEKHAVSAFMFEQLVKYFGNLAVVEDDRYIMTVCNTLAQIMWKGNFTVERIDDSENMVIAGDNPDIYKFKADEAMLSVSILEERYAAENRMMKAVSQGNAGVVEQLFGSVSGLVFEQRANDPVRNIKNYLVIGNTLMRKAAEYGSVHPFYIDGLSTDFAKKIEKIKSVSDSGELMHEMVQKYCDLVKTHSMKNYSPFVQKIITTVDSDLTADLSLRNFSRMLNVNSSYLSVLFKKETGKTLTEYVAQKRIERAAYLLRTTKMQIQTVALNCGIYDVNYFAKIFKKVTGKTPKEYRNNA